MNEKKLILLCEKRIKSDVKGISSELPNEGWQIIRQKRSGGLCEMDKPSFRVEA